MIAEARDGLPDRLAASGQPVLPVGPYEHAMGHAQVILLDNERGVLIGAHDPRSDGLAAGL